MTVAVVLTNDWELFGDCSGDYFEIQHRPLQRMMTALQRCGAKVTVFAEVAQQWAHQQIAPKQQWAAEVVGGWESVLQEAVRRGHDVQLHLHPRWLTAQYGEDGWTADMKEFSTAELPPERLERLFRRGREYLESFLTTADSAYRCTGFRAGGYRIEPSAHVIAALLAAGFQWDSSVVKGLVLPGFYDFRDAHSNVLPWRADPRCIRHAAEGTHGLLELAVCADSYTESPLLRRLGGIHNGGAMSAVEREWFAQNRRVLLQRYPMHRRSAVQALARPSLPTRLARRFLRRRCVKLDYDMLGPRQFVDLALRVLGHRRARLAEDSGAVLPLVAIGHIKSMHDTSNLERICDALRGRLGERLEFWTLSEAAEYWRRRTAADDPV